MDRNIAFSNLKVWWFTTWEGEENKKVEEGEFENINHHSAKGHLIMLHLTQGFDEIDQLSWTGLTIDLKWSKVGVDRKNVDKLQRRKYVCRSEKTLQSISEPKWKCNYRANYVIYASVSEQFDWFNCHLWYESWIPGVPIFPAPEKLSTIPARYILRNARKSFRNQPQVRNIVMGVQDSQVTVECTITCLNQD